MKSKALQFIDDTNLNAYDIRILTLCFEKSYSVAEMQNTLGLAHKNLLLHLRKLQRQGLITIKDFGRGKKKEIRTNNNDLGVCYFMFGLSSLWTHPKILKKDKKLCNEIRRFLKENGGGKISAQNEKTFSN